MSKYEEWVYGCCGECRHYKKCLIDGLGLNGSRMSEWTCCNSDSDYYMDYTGYTDTCEEFEQRGVE